jgi:uncharacterized membrane protein
MKLDDRETRIARDVAHRAIRRLNALEYVILAAALGLALAGGALVGWILREAAGVPFRWGWAVGSFFLFVVPGALVYLRELRRNRGGQESGGGGPRGEGRSDGAASGT